MMSIAALEDSLTQRNLDQKKALITKTSERLEINGLLIKVSTLMGNGMEWELST